MAVKPRTDTVRMVIAPDGQKLVDLNDLILMLSNWREDCRQYPNTGEEILTFLIERFQRQFQSFR